MLNIFARARAVVNFTNSDGCIVKLPILNHEVAPLISTPNNKTAQNILSSISSNNFDSTLGVDKKINTFLNLDSLVIREALNMKLASNKEVFLGLRKLRNKW